MPPLCNARNVELISPREFSRGFSRLRENPPVSVAAPQALPEACDEGQFASHESRGKFLPIALLGKHELPIWIFSLVRRTEG
jgi:hypothetical protein